MGEGGGGAYCVELVFDSELPLGDLGARARAQRGEHADAGDPDEAGPEGDGDARADGLGGLPAGGWRRGGARAFSGEAAARLARPSGRMGAGGRGASEGAAAAAARHCVVGSLSTAKEQGEFQPRTDDDDVQIRADDPWNVCVACSRCRPPASAKGRRGRAEA